MATVEVDRELYERIAALGADQKREVLDFVRALDGGSPPPGLKPGTALLRFGGTIRPEALDEMERLIQEDCERVDPDAW